MGTTHALTPCTEGIARGHGFDPVVSTVELFGATVYKMV